MKNELAVIESVDRRLQKKREPIIFPLTPTHRKELRELRNTNIGNLREQLKNIRELKKEEYIKRHQKLIQIELDKKREICNKLNKDWENILNTINNLIDDRKKFEKSFDLNYLHINNDYGDLPELEKFEPNRKVTIDVAYVSRQITSDQFKEKYGHSFDAVDKKINDIYTKYEEAINFGDLEIVKELYYIMKRADILFDKIDKLKV